MSDFISLNHTILAADDVFLPAISAAALYGKGVFTTVAVHDAMPFLWEKHWQRLTKNASQIKINLEKFSETSVRDALLKIVEKNNLDRARARVTFFDESALLIWREEASPKTALLIQTAEFRPAAESFRLTVSPYRVNSKSPLAGVKSCNYLENMLAFEDAKSRGFDEAIRLNEKDEIVAACLANVFWKKHGAIFTPPLETGCLNGTTRGFVMENFAVRERKAALTELLAADEIFLTSSGIGIVFGKFET